MLESLITYRGVVRKAVVTPLSSIWHARDAAPHKGEAKADASIFWNVWFRTD